MEYIVLGLLMLKSMTIYELNASFSKGLTLIYSASYGNLQYAVKKLLKVTMISYEEKVDNGRNKKIYHVNDKGINHFFEWMSDSNALSINETTILSKIYFLGLVEDHAERLKIIELLESANNNYLNRLKNIEANNDTLNIPSELMDIAKYQMSTLSYGIGVYEFTKNWLNELKKL